MVDELETGIIYAEKALSALFT